MTDGMDKYWIIPREGDKELPRVSHQLASCSLLISYVLIMIYYQRYHSVYNDSKVNCYHHQPCCLIKTINCPKQKKSIQISLKVVSVPAWEPSFPGLNSRYPLTTF